MRDWDFLVNPLSSVLVEADIPDASAVEREESE